MYKELLQLKHPFSGPAASSSSLRPALHAPPKQDTSSVDLWGSGGGARSGSSAPRPRRIWVQPVTHGHRRFFPRCFVSCFSFGRTFWVLPDLAANTRTPWFLLSVKVEPPVIRSVEPMPGVRRMLCVQWAKPALAPISLGLNYTLRLRANESDAWVSAPVTRFCRRAGGRGLSAASAGLVPVLRPHRKQEWGRGSPSLPRPALGAPWGRAGGRECCFGVRPVPAPPSWLFPFLLFQPFRTP